MDLTQCQWEGFFSLCGTAGWCGCSSSVQDWDALGLNMADLTWLSGTSPGPPEACLFRDRG